MSNIRCFGSFLFSNWRAKIRRGLAVCHHHWWLVVGRLEHEPELARGTFPGGFSILANDPNFVHSVVLMIHHDQGGAMGVVINRPSEKTVREVWEIIGNDPCDRDDLIYMGGPVPGPLVALHSIEPLSDHEVLPGLYVSTHCDALDVIVRKETCRSDCLAAMPAGAADNWKASLKPAGGYTARPSMMYLPTMKRFGRRSRSGWPGDHGAYVDFEHVPPDPSLN